jgi:ATP-dependent DNA helicase RecG
MSLPIDINKLLKGRVIEWDRLEFKKGWNPEEIIHTICAFANDVNNWGGGYIIVGIEEKDGAPVFPPTGLNDNQIDKIQKELVELCHRIEPHYLPVSEPVVYENKYIFVIWAPGGDKRPYKAPQTLGKQSARRLYIRQGSISKLATPEEERFLNTISIALPFDDRINNNATVNELDKDLLIEFLYAIGSTLYRDASQMNKEELALRMQLLKGAPEDRHPVNVALLFFNPEPHTFFRGAFSEVVLYNDYEGITFTEKTFKGALFKQIRDLLEYLKNIVLMEKVIKIPKQAEAKRIWNYPYEAVEEAVVNAFYHRSYENVNPIEISIYPDKMVILSFPGPLPPIDKEALKQEKVLARDYRNRRIGDMLKELDLTEGRGTGFPLIYSAMQKNKSPKPIFETDEKYTHFLTILPVQPDFLKNSNKSANSEKIMALIRENSRITAKEMAGLTSLSVATVKRILDDLKNNEFIERQGSDKYGVWIVKKQIDTVSDIVNDTANNSFTT